MKLKDAIALYKQEKQVPANAYTWYRKSAQARGAVWIGNTKVPAYKDGGIWHVDNVKFSEAIQRHRDGIEHLRRVTEDYAQGRIHGNDGDTIRTGWGGYQIRGGFRFVWSDYERNRRLTYGTWYCNTCNTLAETEHNKPECHLCSDWNRCGRDCTLSKVYCTQCGVSIEV